MREGGESLDFFAERSLEMVRAYTGLEEVPKVLENVCVEMTVWLFDRTVGENGGMTGLKSIQEGNVSMSFSEDKKMNLLENEMLDCFSTELNRVRKVAW